MLQGEDTEMDKVMLDSLHDPLVHILRNAVDHGIESPQERLAAGKPAQGTVTISALQQGGEVTIEVKDDGPGIPPEDLKRIFERFYRVEKSRSKGKGGTGLGLAIVKHILEGHKSKISVSSTLGKGSIFSFDLPLEKEKKKGEGTELN